MKLDCIPEIFTIKIANQHCYFRTPELVLIHAVTTSWQCNNETEALPKLLVFTGSVFENSSLSSKNCNPQSETLPYQRFQWDSSWSCVLLTIIRKSSTPNEAEALDTDADRMLQNLGRWIVLQRKSCFLYKWVRWENHFRRYYYNERTVVIFILYKQWTELETLKTFSVFPNPSNEWH